MSRKTRTTLVHPVVLELDFFLPGCLLVRGHVLSVKLTSGLRFAAAMKVDGAW